MGAGRRFAGVQSIGVGMGELWGLQDPPPPPPIICDSAGRRFVGAGRRFVGVRGGGLLGCGEEVCGCGEEVCGGAWRFVGMR